MASTPVTANANIKLGPLHRNHAASSTRIEESRREEAVALHPVDGGFHAWLFVFSAFVLECLVWGFPFCYGIFQNWYLTHEFSGASEASINAVGTVSLGIQYLEGIFCILVARRYPHLLRKIMQVCLLVCVASMFVSSFATQVWQLIILQGVIYGLSAGFLYAPVIFWLTDWFVERRSLASALVFGGGGLGGAVFPLLMERLLVTTGFRWTLRAWSAILLVLGGVAIMGTKSRLPLAPAARPAPLAPIDLKFTTTPLFASVASTILVQGLAYFCVSLYIPSYASALGYSRTRGTVALSVFNLASVVGQVLFGYYCDRRPFTRVMVFSGIASSVLAYCLWGFAHTLTTVYIFIVAFASISGGFSSVFSPASAEVAGNQPANCFMCFGIVKGVSVIVGPLIAAALHPSKGSGTSRTGAGGWGGYGFTGITIFVGSAMAATSVLSIVSALVRNRVLLASSRPTTP